MSGRQGGAGRREVAYRLFAAEYDDASFEYSEEDEERAPNYVVTPTGARVNRLFVAGVLTEVESVSEDVLRARVADPTGAFVLYAGQYQPDAVTFLERAEPPAFVAVTGKARTYRPDDSDRVFTSIRPESINEVDADTRDRWTVGAAAHTLDRVATLARALDRPERGDDLREWLLEAGVDYGLASGVPLAIEHYGPTRAYLAAVRDVAVDAARVVAGEADEVEPLGIAPDEGGEIDADLAVDLGEFGLGGVAPAVTASGGETAPGDGTGAEAEPGTGPAEAEVGTGGDGPSGEEPEATTASTDDVPAEGDDAEAAPAGEAGDGVDDDGDVDAEEAPATDEMYEFDEGERESIEEEYGTEFQSGTEVDEPGEADIETPEGAEAPAAGAADPEGDGAETGDGEAAEAGEAAKAGAETADADEAGGTGEAGEAEAGEPGEAVTAEAEETAAESETEAGEDEPADGADLEEAAVAAMQDLDDGDGADREAVIDAVADEHGVDPEAVEEAIDGALMSGRCYEPEDGRLKAI